MADLDWLRNNKPTQLTRDDLKTMTPEQIIEAEQRGHLTDLLAPPTNPFAGIDLERLEEAARTGTIAKLREQLTNPQEEN